MPDADDMELRQAWLSCFCSAAAGFAATDIPEDDVIVMSLFVAEAGLMEYEHKFCGGPKPVYKRKK